jgi:hypothetical protein
VEHSLRVFDKRVLRRIFGPKRDEVMGGWRKLHNKELRDLYFLHYQVKVDQVGGVCGTNGGKRNMYRLLVGKTGKETTRRPRCRWVNNTKMNLVETGWGGVDWIGLTQDRYWWIAFVFMVMNLWFP